MNYLCFIPLANGQSIPKSVYQSLVHQTVHIDIIPACTKGIIHSNKNTSNEKLIGEMNSRNAALDMIRGCDEEYVFMQDRDCEHLETTNYEKAVEYMKSNPHIGILSLPWKDESSPEHVKMTAMVIRVGAVQNFKFRYDHRRHLCLCMAEDLVRENWSCVYLPSNRKLVREIVEI